MPVRKETPSDRAILQLKLEGLSFREISLQLRMPSGSVASRYYRLKGIRHRSQMARDEQLRKARLERRMARNKERSSAAIRAAIELRGGLPFSAAVGKARSKGASLEMIGACLGITKQALHKQWHQREAFAK